MTARIKLLVQMAGDHGNHVPGALVEVPVDVARQLVRNRHAEALDPLPEVPSDPLSAFRVGDPPSPPSPPILPLSVAEFPDPHTVPEMALPPLPPSREASAAALAVITGQVDPAEHEDDAGSLEGWGVEPIAPGQAEPGHVIGENTVRKRKPKP